MEAARRIGITEFTEIQRLAFPLLHSASDALLISPTGSGKTEAALFPLLSRQLKDPSPGVSLLYITPLRALNRDLEHRLVQFVREIGLTAAVRHGDTPAAQRLAQSRRPPDLLLTTPETLQLLLVGKRLRESLRNLRAVIVDEVHELAPSDRGAQLALSLERLDAWVGHRVRRVGLSATVGNPESVAQFLSPSPRTIEIRIVTQPRELELTATLPESDAPPLDPTLVLELKAEPILLAGLQQLEKEIRAHTTTLIFVNTRPTAEGLAARLIRMAPDLSIAVHHGSLSREVREESERAFREGELQALVATSSLELGIDIGGVDHVVQFGSPHQVGRLVQRIGRSGHRLDRTIHGTVLALDEEDLEESAVISRRARAGELEPIRWRTRNRLAVAQQVLGALRAGGSQDLETLSHTLRHAVVASELSDREWSDLLGYLERLGLAQEESPGRIRPGRGTLDRFYATLSLIPDERTYRLRDIATRRLIGTLDERFVLTQILAQPQEIFLLHGRTWRVVEYRDLELLVETVAEIGQEPRWVGEDLPVPFEVAQEIGRLRREGDYDRYPVPEFSRTKLSAWREVGRAAGVIPDDRTITITAQGRLVVYGACFGTRTNETLALGAAGVLTERLGARVEVIAIEPTWFILELPIAMDSAALRDALAIDPQTMEALVERLVPSGLDYRWIFLSLGRKLGVLPTTADPRDLRVLEPLLQESQTTPLGAEALEKTLHDRYDIAHARQVLEGIRDGRIAIAPVAPSDWTDHPLARLKWRVVPEIPPPTLLRAVQQRLAKEPLTLVCLRCGFVRATTAEQYRKEKGSRCLLCHGALSAVLSPRRVEDIDRLSRYAKRKWKSKERPRGRRPPRDVPPAVENLVRSAYTSAELLANYGERALYCLAARGVGPDTARRLLMRLYRNEDDLLTEILRAERSYARTRAFWE